MHTLTIAGKTYRSRLLIGTGKYRDFDETRRAVEASGADIVTVAIRRTNIGQTAGEPSLLDACNTKLFFAPKESSSSLRRTRSARWRGSRCKSIPRSKILARGACGR